MEAKGRLWNRLRPPYRHLARGCPGQVGRGCSAPRPRWVTPGQVPPPPRRYAPPGPPGHGTQGPRRWEAPSEPVWTSGWQPQGSQTSPTRGDDRQRAIGSGGTVDKSAAAWTASAWRAAGPASRGPRSGTCPSTQPTCPRSAGTARRRKHSPTASTSQPSRKRFAYGENSSLALLLEPTGGAGGHSPSSPTGEEIAAAMRQSEFARDMLGPWAPWGEGPSRCAVLALD